MGAYNKTRVITDSKNVVNSLSIHVGPISSGFRVHEGPRIERPSNLDGKKKISPSRYFPREERSSFIPVYSFLVDDGYSAPFQPDYS